MEKLVAQIFNDVFLGGILSVLRMKGWQLEETDMFNSLHNFDFPMQDSASCLNITAEAKVNYLDSKLVARDPIYRPVDSAIGSLAYQGTMAFNIPEGRGLCRIQSGNMPRLYLRGVVLRRPIARPHILQQLLGCCVTLNSKGFKRCIVAAAVLGDGPPDQHKVVRGNRDHVVLSVEDDAVSSYCLPGYALYGLPFDDLRNLVIAFKRRECNR